MLSDQVSASFVRAPRWMLPGIRHLGQSGGSSRCRAQRRAMVRVRRLGSFRAEPRNRHPVADVSFAGAAPSRGVGFALLATTLIPLDK